MMGIIFFEVLDYVLFCNEKCWGVANPYNVGPFIIGELFLMFSLLSIVTFKSWMRVAFITMALLAMILLQTRSSLLAVITGLLIFFIFPNIKKVSKGKIIFLIIGMMVFGAIIFNYLVDYTFIGRELDTVTYRLHMWELGLKTIIDRPWIGIGFDVTPN